MTQEHFIPTRVILYEIITQKKPRILTSQVFLFRTSVSTNSWEVYGARRIPVSRGVSEIFYVNYVPFVKRMDSKDHSYILHSEILDTKYFYAPLIHREDLTAAIILGLPAEELGIHVFDINIGEDLNPDYSDVFKFLVNSAREFHGAADAVFFRRFLKSSISETEFKDFLSKQTKEFPI